jgi:transcriptional regulator with PAS, ATPase and Fis domain
MNKDTELIRHAFLNSDDYIIVCDSKFEIILQNTKCNDLVKVNNVLTLFDLKCKESINNALKGKKQDQNYFELTSKINIDDKIVCVYIKIFPVILKSTYFIFLIKDITYEEDIKKELKIEKMFMFNIMNQLPDSIYIKDKNSNFLRINKTQIEILGVKMNLKL